MLVFIYETKNSKIKRYLITVLIIFLLLIILLVVISLLFIYFLILPSLNEQQQEDLIPYKELFTLEKCSTQDHIMKIMFRENFEVINNITKNLGCPDEFSKVPGIEGDSDIEDSICCIRILNSPEEIISNTN